MGRVWRGNDEHLHREVALKELLLPRHLAGPERAEVTARAMREAQSAARINDPHVITIHDAIEHDGAPWIVMELVEGPSLGGEIARAGRIPWTRAAVIGAQIAGALAKAHVLDIVHRDIKPDNILLQRYRAILTDFGVARLVDGTTDFPRSGPVMGTPRYMAPEVLDGSIADPAADIWSLGATLYHAVQGSPPFEAPNLHAMLLAAQIRSPAPAEHAGPLRDLLQELMAKDPAQRPDASTVAQELSSNRFVRDDWLQVAEAATSHRGPSGGGEENPDVLATTRGDTLTLSIPENNIIDPGRIVTREEFVRALQAVKGQADLTAKEIATAIAVPVSTVRGYFDRNRLPAERARLVQILRICGVPPEEVPPWEQALDRARSQRAQSTPRRDSRLFTSDSGQKPSAPPEEQRDESPDDNADDADLLFRIYIPKTQLYAEQRREMLRHFRTWLTTVQGQDVREEDFSAKNGETVAFFVVPDQPRPALRQDYQDFVHFVEHCVHSPSTAVTRLTEIGIDEATGTTVVADYAKKINRMEMDLRHSRESRLLMLQQTLEGELLDKGGTPQGVATLQIRIKSLLEQVIPPPRAGAAMPALGENPHLRENTTARKDVAHSSVHVSNIFNTFNSDHVIYTANENVQGTANFGPEARQLLGLITQYAGPEAGPLLTALHEIEDPGIPAKERSTARKKLTSFLADLAKKLPGVGIDLLEAYLKQKLGFPGS